MGACISSKYCRVRRNINSNNTQQNLQSSSPLENSYNMVNQNEQIVAIQNNVSLTTPEPIQIENHIAFNHKRNDQIDNLLQSGPQPSGLSANSNYVLNNINSYSSYSYFVPPTGRNKRLKKDKYKYFKCDKNISEAQLKAKREEFWDTAPHFDGKGEIWAALHGAVDAYEGKNFVLAQAIIDSANIILPNGLLNDCYDELGNRYQLPIYVLARPVNLIRKSKSQIINETDSSCSSSKNKVNEGQEDDEDDDDDVSTININNDGDAYNEKKNRSNKSNAIQSKLRLLKKITKNRNKKNYSKTQTVNKTKQENIPCNSEIKVESKILPIKIRISSLSNQEDDIKLEVNLNQTVLALKSQIFDLTKIDATNQRIFFRGKLMRDHQKLKFHKIYRNVVLQCIVRETAKQLINGFSPGQNLN